MKKVNRNTLKRYTFNICVRKNGEYYDDFNEWRDGYSEQEAIDRLREDYPDTRKYEITVTNVRNL